MSTPDEYRRKAEQCRRLKLMALNQSVADLLDQMAREFDIKAGRASAGVRVDSPRSDEEHHASASCD